MDCFEDLVSSLVPNAKNVSAESDGITLTVKWNNIPPQYFTFLPSTNEIDMRLAIIQRVQHPWYPLFVNEECEEIQAKIKNLLYYHQVQVSTNEKGEFIIQVYVRPPIENTLIDTGEYRMMPAVQGWTTVFYDTPRDDALAAVCTQINIWTLDVIKPVEE